MRQKHNTLLAGVAALALLTGGGIAAAQQNPQGAGAAGMSDHGGAQTSKPSGGSGMSGSTGGMNEHAQGTSSTGASSTGAASQSAEGSKASPSMDRQGAATGKSGNQSAQGTKESGAQDAKQSAQGSRENLGENAKTKATPNKSSSIKSSREAKERMGETAKGKGETRERMGTNARPDRDRNSRTSERNERKGELKGLQGNTSIPMQGGKVSLTSDQRTHIRDSVIQAHGAPRVDHVDFNVSVGTVVPRDRIHVVPVPETLVRIDPQWHGYLYFIVEDEVVIVNPRDMRIVAVLDV